MPKLAGRVSSGRDDDRPTEDDIAKSKLGEQGIPGKPPKPPIADEDELQIPKPLDPGHTRVSTSAAPSTISRAATGTACLASIAGGTERRRAPVCH